MVDDLVREPLDVLPHRDVGLHRHRLAAEAPHQRRGLVRARLGAPVVHRHAGSLAREPLGDRDAEAAAGPGNQRHLPFQPTAHASSS